MPKRSSRARTTADELAELRVSVDHLVDQVQVLVGSVDELTQEVQWRNNQLRGRIPSPTPLVLTSMPADPTAQDWKLNRFTAENLPGEPLLARSRPRQTLFD
jgi:hypothetical protein